MKRLVLASILSLYTLTAFSDDAPTGDFSCFDISSLPTISSELNGVLINNFMLEEDSVLALSAFKQVKFSYSLVNRSGNPAFVSVDFVATDTNSNPVVAMSASPILGVLSAGGSETVKAWTYVAEGTLGRVKRFCARVSIAS